MGLEQGGADIFGSAKQSTLLEINSKIDPLVIYKPAGMDIISNPYYFGYLTVDGSWLIKKLDTTSGTTYIKGDNDYSTNWGNRASLTYGEFNDIF
jgi:hypothetical protein